MLYREIIAVCSKIHTKHINTLCGQNVELLHVKLAVHIVTTGLKGVTSLMLRSDGKDIQQVNCSPHAGKTNRVTSVLHMPYSHNTTWQYGAQWQLTGFQQPNTR